MAIVGISDIRGICSKYGGFSHSYWWLVNFATVENANILAHNVSDSITGISIAQMDVGPLEIAYPDGITSDNITISFYETAQMTVIKALEKWFTTVVNRKNFAVQLLSEANKSLNITYLNGQGAPVWTRTYLVVPDGPIQVESTSDKAGLREIQLSLKIVGDGESGGGGSSPKPSSPAKTSDTIEKRKGGPSPTKGDIPPPADNLRGNIGTKSGILEQAI